MLTSELADFSEYLNAVVDSWDARRGRQLPPPSNAEWCLIRWWFQSGIPLRVVLGALRDLDKKVQPRTLMYLEPVVADAYEHWQRALSGTA